MTFTTVEKARDYIHTSPGDRVIVLDEVQGEDEDGSSFYFGTAAHVWQEGKANLMWLRKATFDPQRSRDDAACMIISRRELQKLMQELDS
jgi:hypothetical protein